jgi:hypothetical protein
MRPATTTAKRTANEPVLLFRSFDAGGGGTFNVSVTMWPRHTIELSRVKVR